MATPATTDRSIEIGLESLRLMLDDLLEVAGEWARLGDSERASWSLDWDQVIATDLNLLDHYYHAGEMTSDQQARYQELLCQLKAALPLIERLGLYPPPVSLEA
jgi:hypothetical protein